MKKILLILGVFSSSLLLAAMFEHNTDVIGNYEFDSGVTEKNEKLSARLNTFQNSTATQEEINLYLDNNESGELYEKGTLITYTQEQKDKLNISEKNIEDMVEQKEDVWFVSAYHYVFDDSNSTKDANSTLEQAEDSNSSSWFGSLFSSDETNTTVEIAEENNFSQTSPEPQEEK